MGWRDCIEAVKAASGRALTDDEVEAVAEAVHNRIQKKMRDGLMARDAATEAGKELLTEAQLAASLKRRDAYNNLLKHADLQARIVPGQEALTEHSVLQGRQSGTGRNFANSVDANHHGLRAQLLGPLVKALSEAKLLNVLKSRDRGFDLDVARELYRRDDPAAGPASGNKAAVTVAKLLGDTLDTMRAMQNKAGAFIGHLENYMGRQYHDMWKIRGDFSDAAFANWRDKTVPRLDMDKMYGDAPPEHVALSLRQTWQALASGLHDTGSREALGGFQGTANLGKKVSQNRTLQFKSADDWFHYNEDFGKGGVMDAIVSGADGAARDTALMQTFGTNPKAMFDRWHNEMMDAAYARGDGKAGDTLKGNPNDGLFDVITGRAAIPQNANIAYVAATVRNSMQLIHLGSVIFPAMTHLAIIPDVLRHNGIPLWKGLASTFRSLVPPGPEAKEIAHALGAGIDGMMGHVINRFRTEDGAPGAMAEAVNVYHKLNGFGYYLDALRTGQGLALSHNLAFNAGKEFADLAPKMQATLRRYGIEQGEWDTGRASAQQAADGRNYLMPSAIGDEAVSQKFQTYITDQIREGLNDHTPYARQLVTFGTKPGTVSGEIVRSLTQFKAFTVTMMERQMGRAFTRNGVDIPGALYLMVGMTMAGYAGNTLRDLFSNQSVRQPKDAAGWAGVVRDAMIGGGATGLYGDVLLKDTAKSGGDVLKSFAGPSAATVADAIAAVHSITAGANTKSRGQIALREGQHLLANNVPNLFYAKAAYDYLFPYMFREMASPGATMRHEKLMRDQGQHFILPP